MSLQYAKMSQKSLQSLIRTVKSYHCLLHKRRLRPKNNIANRYGKVQLNLVKTY